MKLTRDEMSLLLYIETCAVDYAGKIDVKCLNNKDFAILEKWNEEEFITFGRVAIEDITYNGAYWCLLSDKAWEVVHAERKNRAGILYLNRRWKKTGEE